MAKVRQPASQPAEPRKLRPPRAVRSPKAKKVKQQQQRTPCYRPAVRMRDLGRNHCALEGYEPRRSVSTRDAPPKLDGIYSFPAGNTGELLDVVLGGGCFWSCRGRQDGLGHLARLDYAQITGHETTRRVALGLQVGGKNRPNIWRVRFFLTDVIRNDVLQVVGPRTV